MYGPRTQASGETNYLEETIQVLDRTKALYGPRTQASGETNYLEAKTQVLDRTKALYGPQTQAYGETKYLKEKLRYMGLRNHPRRIPPLTVGLIPTLNGLPSLPSDPQYQRD